MKKVNVLISTYNGEKYIKQQLESIFIQTYHDIDVYVRDDGSTDGTLEILRDYETQKKVKVFTGANIGYGRSFLWLLDKADDGSYWAFCDQDDVWEKDKLSRAVETLDGMEVSRPNLYVHDFIFTDEKMNKLGKYGNKIRGYDFNMAITECLHMGFSTVFNDKFREYMLRGDIKKLPSHDWWAELIAMEFGNIYIDEYVGAFHRRLDNSISENSVRNRIKWFLRAIRGDSEIHYISREFYRVFFYEMNIKDKRTLNLFVYKKYNLWKALAKTCYPKRWRSSLVSEFILRFLMLTGRI